MINTSFAMKYLSFAMKMRPNENMKRKRTNKIVKCPINGHSFHQNCAKKALPTMCCMKMYLCLWSMCMVGAVHYPLQKESDLKGKSSLRDFAATFLRQLSLSKEILLCVAFDSSEQISTLFSGNFETVLPTGRGKIFSTTFEVICVDLDLFTRGLHVGKRIFF